MSYQHWELLTRMATGPGVDLAWVCRELVRQSDVERLFCVVRRGPSLQVVAVDCDGYPLGYGEQRLRDSEFAELAFAAAGRLEGGVVVTRRISRASKRTAVVASLQVSEDLGLTLILENRFAGKELATLDDQTVEQWVVLVALSVRLNGASAGPSTDSLDGVGAPSTRHDANGVRTSSSNGQSNLSRPLTEQGRAQTSESGAQALEQEDTEPNSAEAAAQRSETLGALEAQRWNISRAARVLGMTRHGLKKRMRRLHVARPS